MNQPHHFGKLLVDDEKIKAVDEQRVASEINVNYAKDTSDHPTKMSAAAKHNDVLGGYFAVSYRLSVESILTSFTIQNN